MCVCGGGRKWLGEPLPLPCVRKKRQAAGRATAAAIYVGGGS